MPGSAVSHELLMVKLANLVNSVNNIAPTNGNVSLTAFDVPYAYYTYDVTAVAAPPALPRARSWRVTFEDGGTGVGLVNSYDYRRYFYMTSTQAVADDPRYAVAAWIIEGRHMRFEYYAPPNAPVPVPTKIVDLTNAGGMVQQYNYRPIEGLVSWFFGPRRGANAFPEQDNARSILDIDIEALFIIMGANRLLQTTAQQVIPAINELLSLYRQTSHVYVTDLPSPDHIQGFVGDIAITPYAIYSRKVIVIATGFMAVSNDPRFSGFWIDQGVNTINTQRGGALGTHWYIRQVSETERYALVWSNFSSGQGNTIGSWLINPVANMTQDNQYIARHDTTYVPVPPAMAPPLTGWLPSQLEFTSWTYYEDEAPSGLGWEIQYNIRSTADGRLFVGDNEIAARNAYDVSFSSPNFTSTNVGAALEELAAKL